MYRKLTSSFTSICSNTTIVIFLLRLFSSATWHLGLFHIITQSTCTSITHVCECAWQQPCATTKPRLTPILGTPYPKRVRSPCMGHLLGFWVPVEIRGCSLVRRKAVVNAYMPLRKKCYGGGPFNEALFNHKEPVLLLQPMHQCPIRQAKQMNLLH